MHTIRVAGIQEFVTKTHHNDRIAKLFLQIHYLCMNGTLTSMNNTFVNLSTFNQSAYSFLCKYLLIFISVR